MGVFTFFSARPSFRPRHIVTFSMPRSFDYDIFISYSHIDNQGAGHAAGWILKFYQNLDVLLRQLLGTNDIRIWWDAKKLDGTKLFDISIQEGIRGSATLLCLTSHGYLNSSYCQEELKLFRDKAALEPLGIRLDDRSRVVHAQLQNISYQDPVWPAQLHDTTGFPFFAPVENPEDVGFPLSPTSPRYLKQLQTLGEALRKLLLAFPNDKPAATTTPEKKPFTVFLGAVHDDLQPIRKRVAQELANAGIQTLPGIPPPYDAPSHEAKLIETFKEADLSIHLLAPRPGREIDGVEGKWYPSEQADLALQHASKKIIWVPADLETTGIEEPAYRSLLTDIEAGRRGLTGIDFIRGDKSAVVPTLLAAVKQAQVSATPPIATKGSVLLDTHFNDQLFALDLTKEMMKHHVLSFINPHEDEPAKNIDLLADRISMVTKLIFLYGKVSASWVVERMNAVLKLIINNNYAVDEFFVLLLPPNTDAQQIELPQKWLKVNVLTYDQYLAGLNTTLP
jgi:TIR domain